MPGPVLVDSHAHLTMPPLVGEVPAVLDRAREAGVEHVLTVGTTVAETREALALARRFPHAVSAAGGLHPHESSAWDPGMEREMEELARGGELRALGETGLDFHYDHSPRPVQEEALRRHLALAHRVGLPLIIHLRDGLEGPRARSAYDRALEILRQEGAPPAGGVVHCYSGSADQAKGFLALGFFLSLSGTITFPSQRSRGWNREVLAGLPLDRLLVETDAPFLAPHPRRGKTNEPALVSLVAAKLAEVKGVSLGDAARVTSRNASLLFGLPLPIPAASLAYAIRDSVYLNVTTLCPNACAYCRRGKDPVVKGHDLTLPRDPTVEEMMSALEGEGWRSRSEVVFCGYGEPACRLPEVLETATRLKALGARRVRLNTNGLGSLMAGQDIVPLLAGRVDAVSVSLNAQDEETYLAVCRPTVGPRPWEAVLAFARSCVASGIPTTLTAVPWPGVDLDRCREIAQGMGAGFRVRVLDEVG